MTEANLLVIVGAGHAGFQLAAHYGRTITTGRSNWSTMNPMRRISARLCQRHIFKGDGNLARLVFRPKAFLSEQRIELIPAKAEALDRGKKDSSVRRS
jgi:3-phenylpropionate/trans-cinnamate dioxygenase ferredoxin reductase subunit